MMVDVCCVSKREAGVREHRTASGSTTSWADKAAEHTLSSVVCNKI